MDKGMDRETEKDIKDTDREIEIFEAEIIDPPPCRFEGVQPPTTHDKETRDEVIRRIIQGDKLHDISRDMGLAISTMGPWIKEIEDDIRLSVKAENISLIQGMGEAAEHFIRRLTKVKEGQKVSDSQIVKEGQGNQSIPAKDAKDLAIALGVLIDKRKDLTGPGSGNGKVSMKVAWKDGSGAVEVTTGGQG